MPALLIESAYGEAAVTIPETARSLAGFTRWAHSDGFPQRGRIDFLGGRIELDMSPEDLYTHGALKTRLTQKLDSWIEARDLGDLFVDCTRVRSDPADLSCEPDLVFISHEAVEEGRVRLIEKAGDEFGRYVEIEGGPDIVVEIVSDSSVIKDTERLPRRYFNAGVREYWVLDARGEELRFTIGRTDEDTGGFVPSAGPSPEGEPWSGTLGASVSVTRRRGRRNRWVYQVELEEIPRPRPSLE